MQRVLLALLAIASCKAGDKVKPLREAIVGEWEVWCYTSKDTAECLGKDKHALRKTFHPDGRIEMRRADDNTPSSDDARWTLANDELVFTITGGGIKLV